MGELVLWFTSRAETIPSALYQLHRVNEHIKWTCVSILPWAFFLRTSREGKLGAVRVLVRNQQVLPRTEGCKTISSVQLVGYDITSDS